MGNSSSTVINTDLLIREIRSVRSSLSARDRRLFNHAKFAIAEEKEKMNDCELFIDFEDRDGVLIQTNSNPSGRILVGYDGNDKPYYAWERRGFIRAAKKFFVKTFHSLLSAAESALSAITRPAPDGAITF